jgi:hypothetical protein
MFFSSESFADFAPLSDRVKNAALNQLVKASAVYFLHCRRAKSSTFMGLSCIAGRKCRDKFPIVFGPPEFINLWSTVNSSKYEMGRVRGVQ